MWVILFFYEKKQQIFACFFCTARVRLRSLDQLLVPGVLNYIIKAILTSTKMGLSCANIWWTIDQYLWNVNGIVLHNFKTLFYVGWRYLWPVWSFGWNFSVNFVFSHKLEKDKLSFPFILVILGASSEWGKFMTFLSNQLIKHKAKAGKRTTNDTLIILYLVN